MFCRKTGTTLHRAFNTHSCSIFIVTCHRFAPFTVLIKLSEVSSGTAETVFIAVASITIERTGKAVPSVIWLEVTRRTVLQAEIVQEKIGGNTLEAKLL